MVTCSGSDEGTKGSELLPNSGPSVPTLVRFPPHPQLFIYVCLTSSAREAAFFFLTFYMRFN